MMYIGRLLFSGRMKLLYALIGLCLVALIMIDPRIAEVFLEFCFNGVIPGTNIVLSPDTMIWAVTGILASFFVVGVVSSAVKRARRNRHLPLRVITAPAIVTPTVEAAATVSAKLPSAPAMPLRFRLRLATAGLTRSISDMAGLAGWMSLRALTVGFYVLKAIVVALFVGLVQLGIAARAVLLLAGRMLAQLSSQVWQWAEPYLWRFDEWLEIQVRKIEAWTKKKLQSTIGPRG
jgi:hypothetical protein